MIQRTLELYYDQLVIGSDLSALAFSYVNNCHLIYTSLNKPYRFNKENNWELQTTLWNDLAFVASQASLLPFSNNVSSIRIEDEKTLKVFTKNNLVTKINFNKLYISDDSKIEGLPIVTGKTSNQCWVVDYFNVECGCEHEIPYLLTQEEFVKKIYFYFSPRHIIPKRDAAAVSTIREEVLQEFDYSQTAAKIKVTKLMKEAGIKGRMNGFHNGNRVYRPIILVSDKRLVYPLGKNIYSGLPNSISMIYDDYNQILSRSRRSNKRIEKLKNLYGINR